MTIFHSDHFKKKLKKLFRKKPILKKKVIKQLNILKVNPRYPSFKLHKLNGRRSNEYSIWIEEDLRIIFIYVESGILLKNIINHDEY